MSVLTPNDLALRLDLRRTGRGWRGTCPACGYPGTLVLRSRGGEADLWCACCRDSAGIHARIEGMAGGQPVTLPDPPKAQSTEQRTAKALACWDGAVPAAGTPAGLYLASRGLAHLSASPALRWRPDCTHPEVRGLHAAMVALVQDGLGKPVAVHRTYIDSTGRKRDMEPPKATVGVLGDGAIRLAEAERKMVVGEGIETAASAGLLLGLPAWAAVSAAQMAFMALPLIVRHVVIAVDLDAPTEQHPNGPGRHWAERAARRWHAQGRKVSLAVPDTEGEDFNDILLRRRATGGAHAG